MVLRFCIDLTHAQNIEREMICNRFNMIKGVCTCLGRKLAAQQAQGQTPAPEYTARLLYVAITNHGPNMQQIGYNKKQYIIQKVINTLKLRTIFLG